MTEHSAQRIVVGVDGSPSSEQALRWAARIAPAIDAGIDVVTVWHISDAYGLGYLPNDYNPSRDAEKIQSEAVDRVFPDSRPDSMRLLVKQGNPPKVLLDASADASLLIVGSRGHGGFVGLLLGSVSASCAEHATCPVLVIHGPHHDKPHSP